VPGDSIVSIKEDERIHFKIYVSDPNGDDNINSVGFISSDPRISNQAFIQNTTVQAEFTWSPGYYFVDESEKQKRRVTLFCY
jgi:hypothetical protein